MECKWCKKSFSSERTISAHMCVKKRRWSDRELSHTRLAHRAFQMFYEMNTSATKSKSVEDFINSQYYEAFVKFGRACKLNEWLAPEKYTEWLITTGVKLKDWASDKQYEKYLREYLKKEPGLKALERTIIYLAKWSNESGQAWQDYFINVTTPRAVYDIRSAKISPWVIYLSETGDQLLTRMSSEQVDMIKELIDPPFWMNVFKTNKEEVDTVRQACKDANI